VTQTALSRYDATTLFQEPLIHRRRARSEALAWLQTCGLGAA